MSQYTLSLVIQGIDNATKALEKVQNNVQDFAKRNEKTFKAMAVGGAAVFAGISLAVRQGKKWMDEFESVTTRLNQLLKTTHWATEEQVWALIKQARAIEKVGVASKESIVNTQAQLATFDLQLDTIEKLTPAIIDYVIAEKGANATTAEFQQMSNSLAQALNGNFKSLTQVWFVLDDVTKEMISNGTEMERAAALASVLDSTYAGFNSRVAETQEWMKVLREREMQQLYENIATGLLPTIEKLNETILNVTTRVNKWITENPELTSTIVKVTLAGSWFVAVLGALWLVVPKIIAWLKILSPLVAIWAAKFIAIAAAITWAIAVVSTFTGKLRDLRILKETGERLEWVRKEVDELKKAFERGEISSKEYSAKMRELKIEIMELETAYASAEKSTQTFWGRVTKWFRDGANGAMTEMARVRAAAFELMGITAGVERMGAARIQGLRDKGWIPVNFRNAPWLIKWDELKINKKDISLIWQVDNAMSRIWAKASLLRTMMKDVWDWLDWDWDLDWGGGWWGGGWWSKKDNMENFYQWLEKAISNVKDNAQRAFLAVNGAIGSHKDNIIGLSKEYQDLKNRIIDINKTISGIRDDGEGQLARRALAIKAELAELESRIWVGELESEETGRWSKEVNQMIQQRNKLLREQELLEGKVSDERIKEEKRLQWRTETEVILDTMKAKIEEQETERAKLIEMANLKKQQVREELSEYRNLIQEKRALDLDYFKFFGERIQQQISLVEQLNNTRSQLGDWNAIKQNTGSQTVNVTFGDVSINNGKDEKRFAETVEKTIVQAIRGQSLWYT